MENRNTSAIFDTEDLKSFFRVARKNWLIFTGIVLLASGIAFYYGQTLPDIYSIVAEVLLKAEDQDNNTLDMLSNSRSSAVNIFGGQQVENYNEIQVLESFDLLRKVVDKLDMGVSYYISGRLSNKEMFSGVPFKFNVLFINKNFYETNIKFKFIDKYHYKITYKKNKKDFSQTGTFGDYLVNPDMKIQVINTHPNGSVTDIVNIDYYVEVHNLDDMVYNIQQYLLDIEVPDKTNVLQITLKDPNSPRGVAFLDTLIDMYIRQVVDHEMQVNIKTIEICDKLVDAEIGEIDTISLNMQNYEEKKNILDIDREEDEYFSQYTTLDANRSTLQAQVSSLNDMEKYIIEDKDPQFLPPSVYVNSDDDFLKSATDELYTDQINRIDEQEKGTKENINLASLDNKIDSLKQKILAYIDKDRTATNNLIADNDSQLTQYVNHIKTIPDKQRGLTNLSTEQDVNEQLYSFLLQEKATSLIEKATIIPKTEIIEQPRSIGSLEPNRIKIFLMFIAGGVLLSVLIIFIRVTFYDRIENVAELKRQTTLPVVGEILSAPTLANLSVAIENNPKSPLTESFRVLRTNLQYMATDASSKALLFTSNGPGEGKTFCSINLGAILAKAEKKVLLLEFDLHKPRIHKALNLQSDVGLSTILIGKTNIKECIIETPIPGMDIILCGPIPPNSSELVLSPRVKDILDFGRKEYDYVIVDTPPIGLISDAFILMNLTDINLFVLNTKYAYRDAILGIQDTVLMNKIKNFGFVLNNVKRRRSKYYYNRYSYGYYGGYGGYGSYGGYGGYGGYKS